MPRAYQLVARYRRAYRPGKRHPERALKSYLQMDVEAISRNAKLWWMRATGAGQVISLQHDGVVCALDSAHSAESVERALTAVSSRAVGFHQPVEVKPMPLPTGLDKPMTRAALAQAVTITMGELPPQPGPAADPIATAADLYADVRQALLGAIRSERTRLIAAEQRRLARGGKPREDRGLEAWERQWVASGFYDDDTQTLHLMPEMPPSIEQSLAGQDRHPTADLAPRADRVPPRQLPAHTRVLYVDGSAGAAGDVTPCAGWGVAVTADGDGEHDAEATHLADLWGPVPMHGAAFEGATQLTNNTAELTAILEALRWVDELDAASAAPIIIRPDSEYAAKTITGVWPATDANAALVRAARAMLARVEASGRTVYVTCVRAHRGHAWNERADRLAARGATGVTSGHGRTWSQVGPRDEGARMQGPLADGSADACFLCFEDFVDPARPNVDASLPTPASESRAPPGLWACEHASCHACVQASRRCRLCPLCRAIRR